MSVSVPLFSTAIVNQGFNLESAIARVIQSHWYVLGQEVASFEQEFASYVGAKHCVTVANGTDAIALALRAAGVQRADAVILAANAGFYGSTAVHAIGAIPRYLDVDESTLTLSPKLLERALQTKPKAVIVTHLYGQLAHIEEIAQMCRAQNVAVIEDCAQAHGASRNGKLAGSFGDIAAFSFYPTKNLGALGDGGAVLTNSDVMAADVRSRRQYGWGNKYHVEMPGGCNSRLDEIQAAVLREKLPTLDAHNGLRRAIAVRYNAAFSGLPMQLPSSLGHDYVAHLYVIRTHLRAELASHLREWAVSSDVHYPKADHRQSAYPLDVTSPVHLPVTQLACETVLSLPCFPGLSDVQVDRVIAAVLSFFANR